MAGRGGARPGAGLRRAGGRGRLRLPAGGTLAEPERRPKQGRRGGGAAGSGRARLHGASGVRLRSAGTGGRRPGRAECGCSSPWGTWCPRTWTTPGASTSQVRTAPSARVPGGSPGAPGHAPTRAAGPGTEAPQVSPGRGRRTRGLSLFPLGLVAPHRLLLSPFFSILCGFGSFPSLEESLLDRGPFMPDWCLKGCCGSPPTPCPA